MPPPHGSRIKCGMTFCCVVQPRLFGAVAVGPLIPRQRGPMTVLPRWHDLEQHVRESVGNRAMFAILKFAGFEDARRDGDLVILQHRYSEAAPVTGCVHLHEKRARTNKSRGLPPMKSVARPA